MWRRHIFFVSVNKCPFVPSKNSETAFNFPRKRQYSNVYQSSGMSEKLRARSRGCQARSFQWEIHASIWYILKGIVSTAKRQLPKIITPKLSWNVCEYLSSPCGCFNSMSVVDAKWPMSLKQWNKTASLAFICLDKNSLTRDWPETQKTLTTNSTLSWMSLVEVSVSVSANLEV